MALQLSNALKPFRFAEEAEIDCGTFSTTIRHISPSSQKFQAEVAKRQRKARRKIAPVAGTLTGSGDEDVELFCDLALISWTMKDDGGKPVPTSDAPNILKGKGWDPGSREYKAARAMFFKLLNAAMDDQVFLITETDEQAEAKN